MTENANQHERPAIAEWLEKWPFAAGVWVGIVAIVIIGRLTPFQPVSDFFHSLNWFTKQALNIAEGLFDRWGYPTVFLAPMLENTIFLGAIIPGTVVMLLAGLAAHDGLISFWPAIVLGVIGAMIGDTISYFIGRFAWSKLGPENRIAKWSEEMREPLMNHSMWLILSYHFAGYSRVVGPAASGFLRIPLLRWMMLDYIGVTLWVIAFMTGGYMLGVANLSLEDSDRNVQVFEVLLFVFFVISILTVVRQTRKRRPKAPLGRVAGTPGVDGHSEPHAAIGTAHGTETRETVAE